MAFNNEITIGTSAPPTGSTNSTPKTSDNPSSAHSSHSCGWTINHTPPTTVATATRMVIHLPNGMTTGRVVMSSCNFRYVTIEPENAIDPTITVATVKMRKSKSSESTTRYSTTAISAAAPPPTPLNRATSCGIAVIFTRRAATSPSTEPTTRNPTINARLANLMPLKNSTPVARAAPIAPINTPVRAVRGDDMDFKARMNKTAATR